MRVVIFGANGSTGMETVKACKEKGYDIVAAVRRPEAMKDVEGIEVHKIDVEKHDTLVAALTGADVLVSCLGHGSLGASAQKTDLYSRSARAYRAAMRDAGVKRIITLSSGGTEQDKAAPWYYTRLLRKYLINTYVDMARMETILQESEDLDWTAVRLTYLLEGESKPYIVGDGTLGDKGNFKIHHVDAGRFIAEEIERKEWVDKFPVLSYAA